MHALSSVSLSKRATHSMLDNSSNVNISIGFIVGISIRTWRDLVEPNRQPDWGKTS